jgi:hypothetical protein
VTLGRQERPGAGDSRFGITRCIFFRVEQQAGRINHAFWNASLLPSGDVRKSDRWMLFEEKQIGVLTSRKALRHINLIDTYLLFCG